MTPRNRAIAIVCLTALAGIVVVGIFFSTASDATVASGFGVVGTCVGGIAGMMVPERDTPEPPTHETR